MEVLKEALYSFSSNNKFQKFEIRCIIKVDGNTPMFWLNYLSKIFSKEDEDMNKAKLLPYGTGTLLLLVGIGATAGGLGAIVDPSGAKMGVSTELLVNAPFTDYFIPGIVLFGIFGIASFFVSFLAFKNHPDAGISTLVLGMLLLFWMGAQVYWIGWQNWLQPLFLIISILEMSLGYMIERNRVDKERMFNQHSGNPAH